MPWRERSVLDEQREFVRLALQDGVNWRGLCRRFVISPDAGYRWLARWKAGDEGTGDRAQRAGDKRLCQLQRPVMESPDGFLRRTRRHPSKTQGRPVRRLLRLTPNRRDRLDRPQNRQASLQTTVSHLSGTNIKRGHDAAKALGARVCTRPAQASPSLELTPRPVSAGRADERGRGRGGVPGPAGRRGRHDRRNRARTPWAIRNSGIRSCSGRRAASGTWTPSVR